MTITLSATTPQNGQTHSNNLSAFANELFEYVWPFCAVGTCWVKLTKKISFHLKLRYFWEIFLFQLYSTHWNVNKMSFRGLACHISNLVGFNLGRVFDWTEMAWQGNFFLIFSLSRRESLKKYLCYLKKFTYIISFWLPNILEVYFARILILKRNVKITKKKKKKSLIFHVCTLYVIPVNTTIKIMKHDILRLAQYSNGNGLVLNS